MYEALRTICACYVRSDREGILDTLHAYRAADALYNIAKAEVALLHPRHSHEACKRADGDTPGDPPHPRPTPRRRGASFLFT